MHPEIERLIHMSSDVATFVVPQKTEDSGVLTLNEDISVFCYLLGFVLTLYSVAVVMNSCK